MERSGNEMEKSANPRKREDVFVVWVQKPNGPILTPPSFIVLISGSFNAILESFFEDFEMTKIFILKWTFRCIFCMKR